MNAIVGFFLSPTLGFFLSPTLLVGLLFYLPLNYFPSPRRPSGQSFPTCALSQPERVQPPQVAAPARELGWVRLPQVVRVAVPARVLELPP